MEIVAAQSGIAQVEDIDIGHVFGQLQLCSLHLRVELPAAVGHGAHDEGQRQVGLVSRHFVNLLAKKSDEMFQIVVIGNTDQWGAGVTMTWNATNKTWEAKDVKLEAGKSIKFKDEDGSWSGVNLGGSLDKLIQGSNDNIPVAQSGTFDIILHLENTDRAPFAELIAR